MSVKTFKKIQVILLITFSSKTSTVFNVNIEQQ